MRRVIIIGVRKIRISVSLSSLPHRGNKQKYNITEANNKRVSSSCFALFHTHTRTHAFTYIHTQRVAPFHASLSLFFPFSHSFTRDVFSLYKWRGLGGFGVGAINNYI